MSYDGYAAEYAHTRWAVPWVLAPLRREVSSWREPSLAVEIGCGTGNYLIALSNEEPRHRFFGFDLSLGMLRVARSRSTRARLARGDAEGRFPLAGGCCRLAYAVDVVHHLVDLAGFFAEAQRILAPEGSLIVVTDSEENIRSRTMMRHFPEMLAIELDRYPTIDRLHATARGALLAADRVEPCEGRLEIDEGFLDKIERKCSSAMRLISPEAHRRGVERVRAAAARGETWLSCYTAITYRRRA